MDRCGLPGQAAAPRAGKRLVWRSRTNAAMTVSGAAAQVM
jgi:hypothetical protein